MVVKSPDGAKFAEATSMSSGVAAKGDCGGPGETGAQDLPAGTWSVEFTGQGVGIGTVYVHT